MKNQQNKIRRVGRSLYALIPIEITRTIDIREGDEIEVHLNDDREIVIKKKVAKLPLIRSKENPTAREVTEDLLNWFEFVENCDKLGQQRELQLAMDMIESLTADIERLRSKSMVDIFSRINGEFLKK